MAAVLFALLVVQAASTPAAPATDVRLFKTSQPRALAEIDTAQVKGSPVGLAWHADGTIYLRVGDGKETRHYLITTAPAVSIAQSDGLPAWAATYWALKSGMVAPGVPTLRIEAEQRAGRRSSVNTPAGGSLAGMASGVLPNEGGEGVSAGVAIAAANATVVTGIVTLRLKGHVVGEWTDEVPQLGMRFGWAPAPMGVLAYVDADGGLFLLDREGRRVQVPGVSHALLPAWSPDGRQILCLQKKTGTVYTLTLTGVE
jgi:hypothetical protein